MKLFYDDSYLVIYHGPIRGGKTLSMSADAATDMIKGKKVYSNYKIEFCYENSIYYAEPLLPEELFYFDIPEIKAKYEGSVIVIDEGALLMAAREFQTATNKVISNAMLLRGKLEVSVYITVQYLSMFEKNMRIQEDFLVFCHDLSFRHPELLIKKRIDGVEYDFRGGYISQSFQDISGRKTGYMYEETGDVYNQIFHGEDFWNIYNTKEFPVSLVKEKIKMADIRSNIHGLPEKVENNSSEAFDDDNYAIVNDVLEDLFNMNQTIATPGVIKSLVFRHNPPFRGDSMDIDIFLMSNGAIRMANGNWNLKEVPVPV